MADKGHTICQVAKGSIAWELDIEPGDCLLSINENEIEDIFDYRFLIQEEYIEVLIEKQDGTQWLLEIDKEEEEDLGLEFENGLMDEYRSCTNKCMFCFIDQMPPNMRETLYFKDDDSRLSFLQGNYITLTNMKVKHIERIIQFHLEPINISVHTTNPKLRNEMLSNRFAGDCLAYLKTLYNAHIRMNAQIVLCKGINDEEELDKTIRDLSAYFPYMESLSVVPVGLTKFRSGLRDLEPFDSDDAHKVIALIEKWQDDLHSKIQSHFVHASDEWYILAGQDFPDARRYDGYLQLENGVGMMRLLIDEFSTALEEVTGNEEANHISIATGLSAGKYIQILMNELNSKFPNYKVTVYPIKNEFFGENITVSGLLTGQDLIKQLKGKDLGKTLLLPINMFKSGEDVFLDDMSLKEIEEILQVKVIIVDTKGNDLLEAVLNNKQSDRLRDMSDVYSKLYDTMEKEK